MKKYNKIKQLSDGHFSSVYLVTDSKNKKFVLKEYKPSCNDQSHLEYIYLNSINIPNVVKAVDFEKKDDKAFLLTEYINGKNADHESFKKFTPAEQNNFLYEFAVTMVKVQSAGICINDIKPDNIVVKNKRPFIIDLGLATLNGYSDNFLRGTLAYSAPEKIERFTNHFAGEVFSFGIFWYYIINGKTPADELPIDEYKILIKDRDRFEKFLYNKNADEFMIRMLSPDPVERPEFMEIAGYFSHDFKKKADTELVIMMIENYVFPSQIGFVKDLFSRKDCKIIKFDFQDEIEKIIRIATLWTESSGRRLIVIDESLLLSDPDSFINNISLMLNLKINTKDDLKTFFASGKGKYKYFILSNNMESSFFAELYRSIPDEDIYVFVKTSAANDLVKIQKTEYNDLLKKLRIPAEKVKYTPNKPYIVRASLIQYLSGSVKSDFEDKQNPVCALLKEMNMPVSYNLLEKVFGSKIKDYLNKGVINNSLSFIEDKLVYKGTAPSIKKTDKKIISELKKAAEEINDHIILGKIAEIERKSKKEIFEHYKKHLMALSAKEHYFSAYQFAESILNRFKSESCDLDFKKKYAFLARMAGEYDVSISVYNDLEKDLDKYEKAVIKTDKAVVFQESRKNEEALKCYEEAIIVFQEMNKTKDIFRTMNNQGSVFYELKNYRESEKIFNTLLHKAQQKSDQQFITMSFVNLASVNICMGDWKKALHFSKKSLELSEKFNKLRLSNLSRQFILIAQTALGNYDLASITANSIINNDKIKENYTLYNELLHNLLFVSNFIDIDIDLISKKAEDIINNNITGSNDNLLRELFFYYLNNGNIIKALKYYDLIKSVEHKTILEAFLRSDIRKISDELDILSVSGNNYDVIYYNTHILMNLHLKNSKELIEEITNFNDLIQFDPISFMLNKLNYSENIKTSGDEIWEVLSNIHRSIEFEGTLSAVLTSVIKIAGLDRAVFFKFSDNKYTTVKAYDRDMKDIDPKSIKVSTTILKETIKFGDIRFLIGLQDDEDFDIHSSIFGLGLRSAVCYPLVINGQIKGVFYADTTSDRKFSENGKQQIETIFIQASSALKNSDMFEQAKKNAFRIKDTGPVFDRIIGNSKVIRDICDVINIAGQHNVNVLITGPTGSGKELVAKALHKVYGETKPMISVNCTAIPENLLESELFGYAKGAFTGADSNRKGKIEEAGEGTLFLDEIGDMSLPMQSKLLRVLQERVVTPLGTVKEIKVNARFITATNKDLEKLVRSGEFREDLLYRLKVVNIKLPSLNERKEDIPLLVNSFINKFNAKFGKSIKNISAEALEFLKKQNWTGNIRQLENLLEKAVIFTDREILDIELFEDPEMNISTNIFEEIPIKWVDYKKFKEKLSNDLDRKYSEKLLKEFNGKIKTASDKAGVNRRQLYRIIERDKKVTHET